MRTNRPAPARMPAPFAAPLLGLAALLLAGPVAPASAQTPGRHFGGVPYETVPTPRMAPGAADSTLARRVDLSIGKSIVIDLPRDAGEVFVAEPKVAN
ncbi:MAG: pilus assembly protein N-terminal domain-containing protein, partial [Hyphomicrobiales bacterium]|nr:pilus assembly protein N-terminal domain-containing protein [Hyphomicrobiales bacterium]